MHTIIIDEKFDNIFHLSYYLTVWALYIGNFFRYAIKIYHFN